MTLGSVSYLAFLSGAVLLYYLVGARFRWALLLAAGCFFYASWRPRSLLVLGGLTVLSYLAARAMGRAKSRAGRRRFLAASLAASLGWLFVFKYFDFFSATVGTLLAAAGLPVRSPLLDLVLPVGLSFYTLQTLGYLLDVYHGRIEPERHLGTFAVYVSFFPIVLSGPIERSKHLLPQLRRQAPIVFSAANLSSGVKSIIVGLFYKLVVADRAAIYVNAVFGNPDKHGGLTFLAAAVFFSFQIYGDFAGYSSIAIGSAKLLGIDVLQNFRRPYLASSIKDFWRRWHISLSTWLRDYVFLPLAYAFSRRLKKERYLFLRTDRIIYVGAALLTFGLCGLWHGANWTYVVWGGLHGLYLAAENLLGLRTRRRVPRIAATYALVLLTWIFFRAASVPQALAVLGKIFTRPGVLFIPPGADIVAPVYAALAIGLLLLMEIRQEFLPGRFALLDHRLEPVRLMSYAVLVVLIVALGVFDGGQFIYVQF